jgi:hypothetical protein
MCSQRRNRCTRTTFGAAARRENPPFMLAAAKLFARIHRVRTFLPLTMTALVSALVGLSFSSSLQDKLKVSQLCISDWLLSK